MKKEFPKMTVSEALAAGYEKCVKDGGSYAEDIDDVDLDELQKSEFWILSTESSSYKLSPKDIKDLIFDDVSNQDQVNDEDGELGDLINDIPDEAFAAISELVNNKLAERLYWPSVGILLVPDETPSEQ